MKTGFSRNNRVKWILGGLGILAVLAILYPMLSGPHAAALSGEDHQAHAGHTGCGPPREAGQSAFAAIAEIVAILNADPDTDWSNRSTSMRAARTSGGYGPPDAGATAASNQAGTTP
jgi:hypothetical protein